MKFLKLKFFSCIAALLIFASAHSQKWPEPTQTIGGTKTQANRVLGRLYVDSIFYLPKKLNAHPLQVGALGYDSTNDALKYWNGSTWRSAIGARFGKSGEDNNITDNRSADFNNSYSLSLTRLSRYTITTGSGSSFDLNPSTGNVKFYAPHTIRSIAVDSILDTAKVIHLIGGLDGYAYLKFLSDNTVQLGAAGSGFSINANQIDLTASGGIFPHSMMAVDNNKFEIFKAGGVTDYLRFHAIGNVNRTTHLYFDDENANDTSASRYWVRNLLSGYGGGGGSNFANANLTFTADRTHNANEYGLLLDNLGFTDFEVKGVDGDGHILRLTTNDTANSTSTNLDLGANSSTWNNYGTFGNSYFGHSSDGTLKIHSAINQTLINAADTSDFPNYIMTTTSNGKVYRSPVSMLPVGTLEQAIVAQTGVPFSTSNFTDFNYNLWHLNKLSEFHIDQFYDDDAQGDIQIKSWASHDSTRYSYFSANLGNSAIGGVILKPHFTSTNPQVDFATQTSDGWVNATIDTWGYSDSLTTYLQDTTGVWFYHGKRNDLEIDYHREHSAAYQFDSHNKGVLIPRMTQTQRDAIASPATSLLIYQTNNTPGFYYYNGTTWTTIGLVPGIDDVLSVNQALTTTRTINAASEKFIIKTSSYSTGLFYVFDNIIHIGDNANSVHGTDIAVNDPSQIITYKANNGHSFLGNINPSTNNTYDLGTTSLKWKDAYFSGAIKSGDWNGNAIAYSKLNLTGNILNADINSSAAIAYSKLNLTGNILNADINSSAAIAYSKLNLSNSIVSGDLTAQSVPVSKESLSAYSIAVNNTNATAAPTEITYENLGIQTFSGTFTWDGTAPTTITGQQFQWVQTGKRVDFWIWVSYTNAGATNTSCDISWPTGLPVPIEPIGFTSTNDVVAIGVGTMQTSTSQESATGREAYIVKTGTGTYKINVSAGSASAKGVRVYISYITP